MKNILAVGSHYDDIEMGCAGTILRHIQSGDNVYFMITHTDEFRSGGILTRLKEQEKSLKLLGIPNLPICLFLFTETDSDAYMIGTLDRLNPDIIFSPSEQDTHQHHRRSSIIAQAIGRKRKTTMLFYDSGSTYDFHPNVFSMINFDKKLEILNCFKSQIEHRAINLDIVQKKDAYWASLITEKSNKYAEGFVVRKMRWMI